MRFPFKELPGTLGDYLRPAVPVTVEGIARAPQLCLLDTGALHNRFAAWVADAAGVDLTGGDEERFAVGGFVTAARQASSPLRRSSADTLASSAMSSTLLAKA